MGVPRDRAGTFEPVIVKKQTGPRLWCQGYESVG